MCIADIAIITENNRLRCIGNMVIVTNGIQMRRTCNFCAKGIDHIIVRWFVFGTCDSVIDTNNLRFQRIHCFITATDDQGRATGFRAFDSFAQCISGRIRILQACCIRNTCNISNGILYRVASAKYQGTVGIIYLISCANDTVCNTGIRWLLEFI